MKYIFVILLFFLLSPTSAYSQEMKFVGYLPFPTADVNLKLTPANISNKKATVYWAGIIRSYNLEKDTNDTTTIEWICDFLPFHDYNTKKTKVPSLVEKPLKNQKFLIPLIVNATVEASKQMAQQTLGLQILVLGKTHGVVKRNGHKVVVVYSLKYAMAQSLFETYSK